MSNRIIERASVRLILADLTESPDDGWISALKTTSHMWAEQNMPGIERIQRALEEEPSSYAVVVYQDPVEQLIGALLKGEDPDEALAEWQSFAGSLLELHERFLHRMSLGSRPLTRVGLEDLLDHVAKSTGLPLKLSTDTKPRVLTTAQDRDTEIYGMQLAAIHLLDLPGPKVLVDQLEVASVGAVEKPSRPDLITKFLTSRSRLIQDRAEYVKLRANNRDQKKELDRIKKENALLIPQLHRTQEELERALLEKRSLMAKIHEMRKGRDYRKTKIQQLERELEEQAGKLEWLRAVRDQHRSAARELRVEQKQSKTHLRTLEEQVETLGAELKSIKSSRSWRYTRVLRQVNGAADRV